MVDNNNPDLDNDLLPDDNIDFDDSIPAVENNPEDDFTDFDFESTSEEDNYENFDESDYSNTQKNGINWFNIGIVIAIIGVIGFMTYSYFPSIIGGGTNNQDSAPVQQPISFEDTEKSEEQPSLFDNPDQLGDDNIESNIIDDTTSQDEVFEQLDNTMTLSNDEMNELFAAIPNATTKTPSAPIVKEQNQIEIDTLPMPSDANPITVDELPIIAKDPIENIAQNQIDDINTRIDSMNDTMESFMSNLENKIDNLAVSSQQVAPNNNSEQLNQLQQTISRLENRIDNIETKPAIETPPSPIQAPVVTIVEDPKPKVVIKEKTPDVLLPTPEPIKKVAPRKRREPAYVPPKITWDLRGASNGQAVLAMRGTQNLNTVQVGQTVRGLGRITSITQENGQWVVRGTNGVVRQ